MGVAVDAVEGIERPAEAVDRVIACSPPDGDGLFEGGVGGVGPARRGAGGVATERGAEEVEGRSKEDSQAGPAWRRVLASGFDAGLHLLGKLHAVERAGGEKFEEPAPKRLDLRIKK
jgi:hypothetical protein